MRKTVLTEAKVMAAWKQGKTEIPISADTIITPSARDTAKAKGVQLVTENAKRADTPANSSPTQPAVHRAATIAMGADHGGFELKAVLCDFLRASDYTVKDFGTFSADPVDYPDFALAVAEAVANGEAQFGIIIDGAGIGSAMVANKVPGVRAACCNDLFTAMNSREHNGANILTLGGRVIGEALAKKIVLTWLNTHFGGGRHQRRLQKISAVDQKYRKPL